ncbi:MAG: hypothetical protein LLF76_04670 [Planctomycetaceae bacterium]|nr:hypothetical protein [Planctomycetaceae bacterium]
MQTRKQKIIFVCDQAPGDLVVLSAAIRDLHKCYPDRFLVDVRTRHDELFLNNPHISRLMEDDPDVSIIEIENLGLKRPAFPEGHYIQSCIQEINHKMGLDVNMSELKGDIYLSKRERAACFSPPRALQNPKEHVNEILTYIGNEPIWIIAPGWKRDITAKAWETSKWQSVVDYYYPRIKFIQIGSNDEIVCINPKLRNVLNLSGKTNMRQLCRLILLSKGVVCHVSLPMHLAAAFNKPCVVVAGGREHVRWAAYPEHRFIHAIGKLPCCLNGGCWKHRVVKLNDGNCRDNSLCCNPVFKHGCIPQPSCMDSIKPEQVIAGMASYLKTEKPCRDRLITTRG